MTTSNKSRLRLTRCRGVHDRGDSGRARVNSIGSQGKVVAGPSGITRAAERLFCRSAFTRPGEAVTQLGQTPCGTFSKTRLIKVEPPTERRT